MMLNDLIRKYDVPVPRYTSYPTVPYWDIERFSLEGWWSAVGKCFSESNREKGISLYIHLPFCESLCTYCACNTRITRNHTVEETYIDAVLKEWQIYKSHFNETPILRELHLGGGTPTFFSPTNLEKLLRPILSDVTIHEDYEFSFEGHPNNTTREHLQTLYDLGFRRVSYGVQDLDERVQTAIHRIQPFENLKRVVGESRDIGYKSISFDLIHGLPYQTISSVENTVSKIISLHPDRIAFYSYAHVPWIKPGQRGYEDADLPSDVLKRNLYEVGRKLFQNAGFGDIGMDHFATAHDQLYKAMLNGTLHRNFMGYTTNQTDLLIGLGTSAISDAKYAYAQNYKKVEEYQEAIQEVGLAIFKGHEMTEEDLIARHCILQIACKNYIDTSDWCMIASDKVSESFKRMEEEGLLEEDGTRINVTSTGRAFIRNICSVFDVRMYRKALQGQPIFSKAI
jgi:oxygen-independent coproporphyrinogen III oxidase